MDKADVIPLINFLANFSGNYVFRNLFFKKCFKGVKRNWNLSSELTSFDEYSIMNRRIFLRKIRSFYPWNTMIFP